jgi:hypothetical protein
VVSNSALTRGYRALPLAYVLYNMAPVSDQGRLKAIEDCVMFTCAVWELISGFTFANEGEIVFDMLGPQMVKPTKKGHKDETRHMKTSRRLHRYGRGSGP